MQRSPKGIARFLSPLTVAGASVRRVLVLGDGDLSCSAALSEAIPRGMDLTVSTFDERAAIVVKYGAAGEQRFDALGVTGGVDATALRESASSLLKDGRFERVVFNFPHCAGKQNIKRNRLLLNGFFASAAADALAPRGEILVALAKGQGGTGPELCALEDPDSARALDLRFRASWMLELQAAEHGLVVADVAPFAPFYETAHHRVVRQCETGPEGGARVFEPGASSVLHALARGCEVASPSPSALCFTFELQFFEARGQNESVEQLARLVRESAARAADLPLEAVSRVDALDTHTHPDGAVSHAFRVALGSPCNIMTREQADVLRETIEARARPPGLEPRPGKLGRRVSRAVPLVALQARGDPWKGLGSSRTRPPLRT